MLKNENENDLFKSALILFSDSVSFIQKNTRLYIPNDVMLCQILKKSIKIFSSEKFHEYQNLIVLFFLFSIAFKNI